MDPGLPDSSYLARSLVEPVAFESIFERHFSSIHRYLQRRAGRDLADDLAAETFVVAFEKRASCQASGSVLPWLYGIATNLLHHRWRSEQRQLRAYARSSAERGSEQDDDTAARAGEPFFTTKPYGAGLGLGLFLARAFADQMGGTLTVQSVVGHGTSVVLELPAR